VPTDDARLARRDRAVLATLVVTAAVTYATFGLLRHAAFLTAGYDLGLFDQAIRGYAHFGAPVSDIKGPGYNLLGDHFHPILVLLAPLYWVWDDPRTLLLAQSAIVASSIVPVYLMAHRRLDAWCAGLLAFAYAFSWPVQAMVAFEFHEVAFALPLLAWTIHLLDRQAYGRALAVAAVLLLVREDMGLVLVGVGAVLALRRQWRYAAVAAVAGLVTFALVTVVVVPSLAPDDAFAYWTYDALGRDLPSALRFALTNPLGVLRIFVRGPKKRTLVLLLAQSGFAAALSPFALLAVPVVAGSFLSSRPNLWQHPFHYHAPVAVVLMLGLVDVLGRARSTRTPRILAGVLAAFVVVGTANVGILFPFHHVPTLVGRLDGPRATTARAALADVPPGVCVEADNRLAAHLTTTNPVTTLGKSRGRASWVVIEVAATKPTEFGAATPEELEHVLRAGFTVVARHGTFVVLHRPGDDARSCR
jgi:uncharacterized membrane protein